VLGQDNTIKLGEDRHLGDLFPFPGVQSIDVHRESVDGKGSHGGGARGALLFVASALLWPSCSLVGGARVRGAVLAGVIGWRAAGCRLGSVVSFVPPGSLGVAATAGDCRWAARCPWGGARAGFYEAPPGPYCSMYSRASVNHLHRVECDVPESSVVRSGCFFKEVVYESKQWEDPVGTEVARALKGGRLFACGRCCCVGPGGEVMVVRFIKKTGRPSVSIVKSFSCPFRLPHPRPRAAAFGFDAGVGKLRAVVLCTC
jgi:hypothetical protein